MSTATDWATTPATTAPAGYTSNLINPTSEGYRFMIANIVGGIVFVGSGLLRLYTRMFVVGALGYDDYACIAAIVLWFAALIVFQLDIHYGMGTHLWDISLATYSPHFLLVWVLSGVVYTACMFAIKTSILLMYRRIFIQKSFIIRWWLVTFFTAGYALCGIIVSICTCRPITSAWDIRVKSRFCIDTAAFYIAIGVSNSISDLLILALPIHIVWDLSLKRRKKLTIVGLFGLGGVSCIVSIVRLKSIIAWLTKGGDDVTWDLLQIGIWSQIELTVAMMCACAPTLKPFFDKYYSNWWGASSAAPESRSNGQPFRSIPEPSGIQLSPYGNEAHISGRAKRKGADATSEAIDSDTESTDRIIQHQITFSVT